MKCKKCNVELKGYRAKSYPFESGFACHKCGREWSNLQIFRAHWKCSEEEKKPYGADGLIFREDNETAKTKSKTIIKLQCGCDRNRKKCKNCGGWY